MPDTNDIDALLRALDPKRFGGIIHTADKKRHHAALTALVAERDSLRAELAAHVNENEALGKQQGEFIETIVELEKQRDELRHVLSTQIEGQDALKQRVAELEAKPPADRQLRALKPWMELVTGIMRSSQSIHCDTKLRLVENLNAAIAAMEREEPDA